MQYDELAPAADLRDLIRCYWFLRDPDAAAGGPADPALPDGSPEMIFNLASPFRARGRDGVFRRQPRAFLVGQITRPFAVAPTGPADLVGVRFTSFGAAVLGYPMGPITDAWTPIGRLPASRQLSEIHEALADDPAPASRASVLDAGLVRIRDTGPAPDPAVVSAVQVIHDSHGGRPMVDVLESGGVTERTLQRRFAREVGVSPKVLARIARFQRVFASWRDEPASWARVAVACGYFDQSHLVRDFRDFAGAAPAAFLATAPEFTRLFLNASRRR